jgi:hypothetical protein
MWERRVWGSLSFRAGWVVVVVVLGLVLVVGALAGAGFGVWRRVVVTWIGVVGRGRRVRVEVVTVAG